MLCTEGMTQHGKGRQIQAEALTPISWGCLGAACCCAAPESQGLLMFPCAAQLDSWIARATARMTECSVRAVQHTDAHQHSG